MKLSSEAFSTWDMKIFHLSCCWFIDIWAVLVRSQNSQYAIPMSIFSLLSFLSSSQTLQNILDMRSLLWVTWISSLTKQIKCFVLVPVLSNEKNDWYPLMLKGFFISKFSISIFTNRKKYAGSNDLHNIKLNN